MSNLKYGQKRHNKLFISAVFPIIALSLYLMSVLFFAAPVYSQAALSSIVNYSIVTIQSERDLPLLAEKFHTTVPEILKENPQHDTLKPGDTLTIRENTPDIQTSRAGHLLWYWPVGGPITSAYGNRNTGEDFHHGIDIAVPSGTEVRAVRPGRIVKAEDTGVYGLTVLIDHGNGIESLYAHNSRLLVSPGQQVRGGQIISYSGNTGKTTGPHVHFEIRYDSKTVDPSELLPAQQIVAIDGEY